MWKDLTLQQKAEIMKMSVANGVTDINAIQELYDGSVGHKFDDGSRIITIGQFPEGFVEEYGDTPISTPSKKNRTTLREAFNNPAWRDLHVDVNSVPYLTDYLLRQEQPNSIYGDRPKKDFATSFNEWKEEHPTLNTIANYTPFVSTVMDGLELYTDPSWGNLGWFAADLASDIFSLGLAKGVTTGSKLINKAFKGSKTITGRSRHIDWNKTSKIPLGDIIEGGDKIEKYGKQTFYQGTDLFQNHLQNTIQDNDVELPLGGHLFDKGGPKNKSQTPKYQYGIIEQILRENGVNFRVTSGFRHPNEAGNAGKSSAHTYALVSGSPAAIDIVPGVGSDWNTLYKQMNSPEVRAALASYGLDILDETNPVTMAKTKATGKHFHVGRGIKNQPGRGTFIGSTNPTIAAFNRVYGNQNMSVPDIDYEALYEPSRVYGLDWSNRPQQEEEQVIQRPIEPIMSVMEREEPQQEQSDAEQDNFVQLPSFRLSSLQSQPIAAQQRHELITPIMQAAAQEAPSEIQSILSSPYIIFGRDLG